MAKSTSAGLTAAEGRRFAWTVGAAFLALALAGSWRGRPVVAALLGALAAALCLAGAIVPRRLGPLEASWMALAHAMSRVTTPIVLGVVFFLVITPIGLVMRLVKRSSIRHQPVDGSFWFRRADERSDLRRQF